MPVLKYKKNSRQISDKRLLFNNINFLIKLTKIKQKVFQNEKVFHYETL